MVFEEQPETSTLTHNYYAAIMLPSQGHRDYRFDMVIMGATLLDCCLLTHAIQRKSTSGFVAWAIPINSNIGAACQPLYCFS